MNQTITIQASNGRYLSAEYGGGIDPRPQPKDIIAITANRESTGGYEQFEVEIQSDGTEAYKTFDGHYITAEGGGGSFLRTDATSVGAWEKFTRTQTGHGQWAILCPDDIHVLCAEIGDEPLIPVNATRATVGLWETFTIDGLTPPLPDPPTRDEMLALQITFQGLTVQTKQFGTLPWFEAALAWLDLPEDRQAVYAAKKASQAWGPSGDTHALIFLPSGDPLYNEADQAYSPDLFGPLDWTNGNTQIDPKLGQLVVEVLQAGFTKILLFLNGDAAHPGYLIAQQQLPLVVDALRNDPAGDLTPYVCIVPGFDGVWHRPDPVNGTGWAKEDVIAFGQQFRDLLPQGYLVLEHADGYLPLGEGDGDYNPGGGLQNYDLILSEFAGPNDSAWRCMEAPDSRPGRRDYLGSQIWQIAARLLGPQWSRPSDMPADADSQNPPFVMHAGTPRGPYYTAAFEWVGLYRWVRWQETAEQVVEDRNYFKSIGYRYGG